jgi:hypothetical protein
MRAAIQNERNLNSFFWSNFILAYIYPKTKDITLVMFMIHVLIQRTGESIPRYEGTRILQVIWTTQVEESMIIEGCRVIDHICSRCRNKSGLQSQETLQCFGGLDRQRSAGGRGRRPTAVAGAARGWGCGWRIRCRGRARPGGGGEGRRIRW